MAAQRTARDLYGAFNCLLYTLPMLAAVNCKMGQDEAGVLIENAVRKARHIAKLAEDENAPGAARMWRMADELADMLKAPHSAETLYDSFTDYQRYLHWIEAEAAPTNQSAA